MSGEPQQQQAGVVGQILNIPQFISSGGQRASVTSVSTEHESDQESIMETESHTTEAGEQEDGGIGLDDDGKSGKLTLTILLTEKLIEPGEGVMSIDYLGQTFKGDLLAVGKIRSVETGLIFNNPSAWAIYCKKIINPAKKSGCGWASVKYKGRKMDYYKNIWLKRKAQRDAEAAKNEAAQALTALSAGLSPGLSSSEQQSVSVSRSNEMVPSMDSNILKHTQVTPAMATSKRTFVELEPWVQDGRMQPFTISVSTSAMLVLDLHSHLAQEDCVGYLAGHWDPNTHNLAITHTFPCLIAPDQVGSETAQKVETSIYEELYGKHLSLVGWYHSNPRGPAAPSVKDVSDQLEFQIKLLGNNDASYTPCIGVICSPYEKDCKSSDSSIVFYWVYPPGESFNPEVGKPMRMSYSVIQDPCLSEDVLQSIDKTIAFFTSQPKESQVKFTDRYDETQLYLDKIGRSLVSKFPLDQDDRLWLYIQTQLLQGSEVKSEALMSPGSGVSLPQHPPPHRELLNGRKNSEEEEIDDDEDTALNAEQEIDDDEDTAIVKAQTQLTVTPVQASGVGSNNTVTISQFSPMGTHMTFTRANDGGQETVNLSIKETDDMPGQDMVDMIEQEQPLSLTATDQAPAPAPTNNDDAPLNFSTSAKAPYEEDSDDERLVIKE